MKCHKLLKNLAALSEYAKCSQRSTKIKKSEILTLYPESDGKKTISRYCPLKCGSPDKLPHGSTSLPGHGVSEKLPSI
jgi:hypothetical protein